MIKRKVTNMADLADAIFEIGHEFGVLPWWRGHRDASWQLLPGLIRRGLVQSEISLTAHFRLMAPVRYDKCPRPDDDVAWLFLMQHYGLPTRLLDWSWSPLVALFFALEKKSENSSTEDKDAAVWALAPGKFNLAQFSYQGIARPYDEIVKSVVERRAMDSIVAVLPEQSDLRYMMQQSAFTLHGPEEPIEELPARESFLARICIPASSRQHFRETLTRFGISRANLFPDLANLARELESTTYITPQ